MKGGTETTLQVEMRELLQALALRHITINSNTQYGQELVERIREDVKSLVFEKAKS